MSTCVWVEVYASIACPNLCMLCHGGVNVLWLLIVCLACQILWKVHAVCFELLLCALNCYFELTYCRVIFGSCGLRPWYFLYWAIAHSLYLFRSIAMGMPSLACYRTPAYIEGVFHEVPDPESGLTYTQYECTLWIDDGRPAWILMRFYFLVPQSRWGVALSFGFRGWWAGWATSI